MPRFARMLGVLAALMGAAGVALAAAAAHTSGGLLAQTGALFLILHAAALLAAVANARASDDDRRLAGALLVAGAILGVGAALFSADLASRAFADARLFPFAAPIGGSAMILGWLTLAGAFAFGLRRAR